ncbi:DUF5662 family protein [Planctomicrobium sp.]|jgi:hypothetical protein|nr:DUF5662 family protein [Planctomicrobium sp.]MDB4742909.1 DUF5662 family protein [Planctomicrobium sp.]
MSELSKAPTAELIAFYESRTHEHIGRVRKCLERIAEKSEHRSDLLHRAEIHDASKFSLEERLPYIWMTEFHRCRRGEIPFAYPPGMEDQVKAAIQHHVTVNRHHPEFHDDPNDMTEVDLIEMVCDWTAMAQEFGEPNGSARGWADKAIGVRVQFSQANTRFIYQVIDQLEEHFA